MNTKPDANPNSCLNENIASLTHISNHNEKQRPPSWIALDLGAVCSLLLLFEFAKVAELADALDLGFSPVKGGGSNPPFRIREQ